MNSTKRLGTVATAAARADDCRILLSADVVNGGAEAC
jgi:hypothetical protein